MPKDTSIEKILLIGSGPIVIGQGCEFDYSGVQACKALKEEGYKVILVNSNPATIMTDPEFADRTYVEPVTPGIVEKIIERENPDALLPTLGGQTGLNTAMDLVREGVLDKYNVKLIGANAEAIEKGEDRLAFKEAMIKIGLDLPQSGVAHAMSEALTISQEIAEKTEKRFPLIIRPAYTLGGSGGGIAYNSEEFETIVNRGLDMSPVTEVLIEESLLGWKEFEMEVMRDRKDNCVVICSIENLDPMGVHTGDSIVVAQVRWGFNTDMDFDGAEIVKVENPAGGDPLRRWTASGSALGDGEDGVLFQFLNASKQSIALDPATPADRETLLALEVAAITMIIVGMRLHVWTSHHKQLTHACHYP